jgi:hypothetical protein
MLMSEDPEAGAESFTGVRRGLSETEKLWNFLGLQVARKTEIIALAAFSLSISTLLWQIVNYTVGPVVRLFPTDQIVITATDKLGRNYSGQDNLLALIATMAYVNGGDTGHNSVIRREYLDFSIGERRVQHRWYEFGSSDVQNGNLTFKRDSEAHPLAVNAGSAASHETLFAAWEIDCEPTVKQCDPAGNFVKWDDFIKTIMTTNQLSFSTSADVYPSKRVTASCVVRLRDWEIQILQKEQWLSAACTDPDNNALAQRKARPQQVGRVVPK